MRELREATFLVPASIKEQEAIAKIGQGADNQIAVLEADADALRKEKSALMQQLLTGKKRVTV